MSLKKLALEIGKSKDYFYSLKINCKKHYNWLFSFDQNKKKSYDLAVQEVEKSLLEIQKIIIDLENTNDLNKFSIWLYNHKYYKNKDSFTRQSRNKWLFPLRNMYVSYKSNIKIINAYEIYKKELGEQNESRVA